MGNEGNEKEGSEGHAKEWHRRGYGSEDQFKEERGWRCYRASRNACHCRGEEDREVHHPWVGHARTRVRPARKAGTAQAFGKTIKVKARAAKTIVQAYCVSALKKSV